MIQGLLANFLATAFLVSIWAYLAADLTRLRRPLRSAVIGVLMGAASIFSMIYSAELSPGVIVDMRAVPIGAAALFGGPIATMVAVMAAGAFRWILGGAGAEPGIVGIALAGVAGLVARHALRSHQGPPARLLPFAVLVAVSPVPPMAAVGAPVSLMLTLGGLNLIGAMAASFAVYRGQERAYERTLLLAAIRAAPEYLYIKDTMGRIVAFSNAVSEIHRARNGIDPTGKTDLDIERDDRGRQLLGEELAIISGTDATVDKLERLPSADGAYRWFSTSKAPVRDVDGRPLGLVGVTRDVTAERSQREQSQAVVDQLSSILAEMANGVALFDFDCRLVFCNEQYHRMFPRTRDVRVPGVHLRDVLRAAIRTGEQEPVGEAEAWIAAVVEGLTTEGEEEARLADGRALIVRNRTVQGFGYVSVVSDVTEIRMAEARLAVAAEQLRILASTDPLTGLANRRVLTDLLDRELIRSVRANSRLSAIMIDVDHFKKFNDSYGHQSGDTALQLISEVLRDTASRGTDIVARYGGEEFCIILPDTDEDGAHEVAERIRLKINALVIPRGEDKEPVSVTASFGIATCGADCPAGDSSQIISRADQALYVAKSLGRNRVEIFRDDQLALVSAS